MLKNLFLLKIFEEFCMFVFQIKKNLEINNSDAHLKEVQLKIYAYIENKKHEVNKRYSAFGLQLFDSILYPMLAFADECLLKIKIEEKNIWINYLLEKKSFNTAIAGEMIFEHINNMLENKEYINQELALIYYTMLSLGFKGKYNDATYLNSLKEQIYYHIYQQQPIIYEYSNRLFPNSYILLINSNFKYSYYSYFNLFSYFCMILFVYFLISHTFWHINLYDINKLLSIIKGL